MDDGEGSVRVDIVSDVVCPWCAIGWAQLRRALEVTAVEAEIRWHPFQLNPDMPEEGADLRDHIAAKYGTSHANGDAARVRMAALGEALGFRFDFFDGMRTFNTFAAHRLLHWAGEEGRQHELKLALLEAYFSSGRNVADRDTLVELAASVGLDADEAAEVLDEERYADEVRALQRFWLDQGVRGVPAMVFAERHLVTGAQGVESYAVILRHVSGAPAV